MKDKIQNSYSLGNSKFLNRRNFLKLGAFAGAGLVTSHLIHKDREAEAVAPALIYAALLGITAAPYIKSAYDHFVQGNVDTENNSPEPKEGYVKIVVLDNSQHFDVAGIYGPYYVEPYSRVYLPYSGVVPNGTGQKWIYAESYLGSSPYSDFYWNY